MKTNTTKSKTNSNSHSLKPFFSKSGEGTFFSQSQEVDAPFFKPSTIQPKLTIGEPGDKYEQEADSMAEKVIQNLDSIDSSSIVQSKNENSTPKEKLQKTEEEGEEMKLSRKPVFESENDLVQEKESNEDDSNLETEIRKSTGNGQPLDNQTRINMEQSFGADFTNVKVHTSNKAVQMNQKLGAKAFTYGSNIYFNNGNYNPKTKDGNRLLAHELTHTVQQGSSKTTIQADFAVEPTTPDRRTPTLTPAQIQSAITFNQSKHTDATEIGLMRDILGISSIPAVIDADFVNAVVTYQSQYGLDRDGKLGHGTADRIAKEIIAEGDFLGNANLGSLGPEFNLKTNLRTLIIANNSTYADYKLAIQGATMIQGHVALRDQQLLRDIKGLLSWNNWARCLELMGRIPPTYNQLINNSTVRASLRPAWTASNPAVNPPVGTQHEEGGWVFLNLITGDLSVRRAAAGAGAAINLSAPPVIANSVGVAKFHTHPNLGLGWQASASPQDIAVDATHGVPDIVIASTNVNPATFTLFPSGPNRRLHLAGNRGLPGATGGLTPQAKSDGSYDEQ